MQRLLDKVKAKGGNTFDVVDDYAYPVPVAVICKILGVPLKDEPTFHGWIFDFMAGTDMGPDAATEEGQARLQKGRESMAAMNAVHGRPDPGVPEGAAATTCCPSW